MAHRHRMLILVGERSKVLMTAVFIWVVHISELLFFLHCNTELYIAKCKSVGIFSVLGNRWGFKELSISATQFAEN